LAQQAAEQQQQPSPSSICCRVTVIACNECY